MNRRKFIPLLGSVIAGVSTLSFQSEKTEVFLGEMGRIKPAALKKNAVIGICTPAGAVRDKNEATKFKILLEKCGFRVKIGANHKTRYGYFSSTDDGRAKEFMHFIQDDEVDAIFFLRGGWGCQRILPLLDYSIIRENPKVIMGFSDVTSLLTTITERSNLVTYHGPNGNSTWEKYTMNYFNRLVIDGTAVNYSDHPVITYSGGKAFGELIGGNLSVLVGLVGTPFEPDWTNKILFLEDVKEEPYRIDRMLTQLRQAGVFEKVNGVVLGEFRKCVPEEPEISFSLDEVFKLHFTEATIPVFRGARIGHVKDKYTVPIGVHARINSENGTFSLTESAVDID